jgi:hypothetical protein
MSETALVQFVLKMALEIKQPYADEYTGGLNLTFMVPCIVIIF